MSVQYISDCCSEEHAAVRLIFTFCCGLARLSAAVVVMQVDRLRSLEEIVVMFFDYVESSQVVGCFQCRFLLSFLNNPFCRFHVIGELKVERM